MYAIVLEDEDLRPTTGSNDGPDRASTSAAITAPTNRTAFLILPAFLL